MTAPGAGWTDQSGIYYGPAPEPPLVSDRSVSWQIKLGWAGMVVAILGYALSVHFADQRWFHWFNIPAGIALGISAGSARAWPNMALTLSFTAISVWALWG